MLEFLNIERGLLTILLHSHVRCNTHDAHEYALIASYYKCKDNIFEDLFRKNIYVRRYAFKVVLNILG